MNELEQALVGDSAAAPAAHILENLSDGVVHTATAGAPHTIYEEVWHAAFWQQMSLEWIAGVETPCPERAAMGFPTEAQVEAESWDELRRRFLDGAEQAAGIAGDAQRLEERVRCPSPAGKPTRTMTVREQLESLAAHNAYHLGRIVLLRQLQGAWPPPSGGFTW
jgi:uncharacterized damage-inducible protein DinB